MYLLLCLSLERDLLRDGEECFFFLLLRVEGLRDLSFLGGGEDELSLLGKIDNVVM